MRRAHPFMWGFYAAAGGLAFVVALRFGLRLAWPEEATEAGA